MHGSAVIFKEILFFFHMVNDRSCQNICDIKPFSRGFFLLTSVKNKTLKIVIEDI